ncbi:LysR family transcriptional regulator [Noviherbaspirillum saxi]|uniref:LysR family transcriptional regulator n=1 Tax=Noviherbaspirillum saxi TaxID=2320863 RepID=A0A3A3FLS2_9BURK|nr:LysR family transcriptional regulator [Noviherbaspirillum saxi]RJF95671.1 LysR family transcriptional regulator [Noviherbaspirillum saxi]
MRFNKLDLNLLVALDALLAERSITKAARRLNLSQSATSGVLARLREYFDDDLLVQVGRNMVPTALAESLIEPVSNILLQIEATIETRATFNPAESQRHFRIVASDYATCVAVAHLVRQLSIDAPGITLDIIMPSQATLERAERGGIDLVLIPRNTPGMEEAASELLFTDTYSCVICANNPLVGERLTLEDYLGMAHVATRFGDHTSMFEDWFFDRAGLHRRIELTASQFNTLPQLVLGTRRIATMHTRMALISANYYPIRVLPPPMAIPEVEMMMKWHRYLDNDPGHQWLRQAFRSVMQKQPARPGA